MPEAIRPVVVRLRNWVGDVVLSLPTLMRLEQEGHALHLVGKGWAADLLAGHGWPVHKLAGDWRARVAQLRALRLALEEGHRAMGRQSHALVFPYSFSSALDMRLAGLKAVGYAREGRSLLLHSAVPMPPRQHELQVYWKLGAAFLKAPESEPPSHIALKLTSRHLEEAWALRRLHGIDEGYVVICPFAGGTYEKQPKTWPQFEAFARHQLGGLGRQVLIVPGPGEEALARERFAGATMLPGVGLGAYAALLRDAAAMVSNDTGPGHLAAAVGTPLLSVLGPTLPEVWGAWGPQVKVLRHWPRWPEPEEALAALQQMLATRMST